MLSMQMSLTFVFTLKTHWTSIPLDLRFQEQVMTLKVFGEIVILFGNYLSTVWACFLFQVVQKNSISWFTPADLQKERATNFIWLGYWLSPRVSLSDFEGIKSYKKINILGPL
jgi:hypothetical protein